MKRLAIILSTLFIIELLSGVSLAEAKISKSAKQKKKIAKWCNEQWFRDNGYFESYGEQLKIFGLEKIKIGDLKSRWTCHWAVEHTPEDRLSYDWWWTTNNRKGPMREMEHHWRSDRSFGDSTYRDEWTKYDKKTKKRVSCTRFSLTGETYCG